MILLNHCCLYVKFYKFIEQNRKINVVRVDKYEYISLIDLAKTQNDEVPADVAKNLLKNKETISFLGVW